MADMQGSESKYAGSQLQGNKGQGAKAQAAPFGTSIVAPPISGPMQNIVPGSQEWINARMAAVIQQLKRQYGDAAARRGMLQSGGAELELSREVARQERQIAAEASDYNASIANREDQQAFEKEQSKRSAKAQETAGMYSGLGSMAPYALFGKWGSDKGGQPLFDPNPTAGGAPIPRLTAEGTQATTPIERAQSPIGKGWDYLTKKAPGVGAGVVGTGLGTALSGSKNVLGSLASGGLSTALSRGAGMSTGASGGLAGLSSALLSSKTLAKPFSKDNWWKTLVGAGGLGASAGLFGKF